LPSPGRLAAFFRRKPAFLSGAATRAEVGLLVQKARLAQRRKNWREATALWRAAVEKAPEDRAAMLGYAGVLIQGGAVDDAATLADVFVRQHPKDEDGPMLLARLAEARGDTEAGIAQWRAALALSPGKAQPLIRLGALLLAERRFADAESCAAELTRANPGGVHGAILRAQIAQARDGFAAAAPLWRAAAKRFGRDVPFLRAYGRALLAAGEFDASVAIAAQLRPLDLNESLRLHGIVLEKRSPFQDHSEYWKAASSELPDQAGLARKWLDATLWARRLDDAEAAFRKLLALNQLRAADADYVVGLGHAYLERGNRGALQATVRAFLKTVRGQLDYRAAALRLHRTILAVFPKHSGTAVAISRTTPRFGRMIRGARIGSGAADALDRVAASEDRLVRSGTVCFLDTDIDPDSCRTFVSLVRARLARGEPFSLIRLGDGEANAFDYEPALSQHTEEDAAAREMVWWGRTLDADARRELAAGVRAAIAGADAIGIPTRARLLRDVRLDSGRPLSTSKSGRGVLTILHALETALARGELANKVLISAHLPQDLQRWNLYRELLRADDEIVLVSCHGRLPEIVQERFGVRVVKHVLMPPGDSMLEMHHRALSDAELPPQSTERALDELADAPRGCLVLVGAGYAGKIIIAEARNRGGVALDVGSIFDRWMGANTRSYQDLA
jgi:tetratricopeptide (TPR) repeat protein